MISGTAEHILTAVSTPRANGQVERFNKVITPMLAKLCDCPSKWDKVLNQVEFALNNSMCRSTGETPSRLLFGIDQRDKINDNIMLILEDCIDDERNLEEMRARAAENIERNQDKNKIFYDKKRKDVRLYNVGDYVMIMNRDTSQGVNKKLLPKWKGPYVIQAELCACVSAE